MGMDELKHEKQDARKRKNGASREQFKLRGQPEQGVADWGGVDGRIIANTIATVGKHGGALRLGYTRDGGAYAIGIYGDGQPHTVYVSPRDDIEQTLVEIAEWFDQGAQAGG